MAVKLRQNTGKTDTLRQQSLYIIDKIVRLSVLSLLLLICHFMRIDK